MVIEQVDLQYLHLKKWWIFPWFFPSMKTVATWDQNPNWRELFYGTSSSEMGDVPYWLPERMTLLVNIQKAMERSTILTFCHGKIHHAINGKIHYFDWAIFNCYVSSPEGTVILTPWCTLWLFNIAMENGPSIDGLPGFTVIRNGDFPWLCQS